MLGAATPSPVNERLCLAVENSFCSPSASLSLSACRVAWCFVPACALGLYYSRAMSDRDFAAAKSAIRDSSVPVADHVVDHKESLLSIISAIATNDFGALHQHFAEDIQLNIRGFPTIDGSWQGREQVVAAISDNFGKVDEQKPQIEAVLHQGDAVAILIARPVSSRRMVHVRRRKVKTR